MWQTIETRRLLERCRETLVVLPLSFRRWWNKIAGSGSSPSDVRGDTIPVPVSRNRRHQILTALRSFGQEELTGAPADGCQPKPWRDTRISLRNGAMIAAYGGGQGIRGAKNVNIRPGLIVVDDIEDQEHVVYEEQRHKLREWFNRTLLHAGHPDTNVIVVGTVLHHDSLLANLIHPDHGRGWTGLKYRAVEQPSDRPDLWEGWAAIYGGREDFEEHTGPEAARAFFETNREQMLHGTRVLWPEREDYHALMVSREREGRASFQAEKQNEPLDPAQCIFAEERFHYWDDEFNDEESLFDAVGRDGYFFGACDPSLGHRTGRGDYTAIVVLYQPPKTEINHVIVADIARRRPNDAIERIIHYARMYDFCLFGVEGNHFQELMVDELRQRAEKANVKLSVEIITNRANKQSRIASVEPEVSQGRIRFCRRHQLLLDQLRQFPLATHDDGPDALEMAVDLAHDPPIKVTYAGPYGILTFDEEWIT